MSAGTLLRAGHSVRAHNAPVPSNAKRTFELQAGNPDLWRVLCGVERALHIVIYHDPLPSKLLARPFGNGLFITTRRPCATE